jgi:predicted transcriptional regulator of viral defense system
MTKINVFQLRKAIPNEEFDYALLSSVLSEYSSVRLKIHELIRTGVIIRVKKGLYVFGQNYNQRSIYKEILANLIYGPSCISLEYALAFHGLIPERVETMTSVTPKRDKEFNTPLGRFTYRYLGLEKYAVGVEQVWLDRTHTVLMASKEKAICDYVLLNKIPVLNSYKEAKEFLADDLRIDQEHWKRFDLKDLSYLNKVYCSTSIESILAVLEHGGGK